MNKFIINAVTAAAVAGTLGAAYLLATGKGVKVEAEIFPRSK